MYADLKSGSKAEMQALKAALMVMLGDEDFLRPEQALELCRMVPNGPWRCCQAATVPRRSPDPTG